MRIYLCFLFIVICSRGFSQSQDDWYLFEDTATQQSYYRDARNVVKTRPLQLMAGGPRVFTAIVPVVESIADTGYKAFYLLRDGREVARDSLYFWDNMPDCERESKIRFRDPLKDKVGMLDDNGTVIIPAVYNDMTSFDNGLAWAIKGAERECWEGGKYDAAHPCEHWTWKGGTQVLLNDKNEVLAEFPSDMEFWKLDPYSLKAGEPPVDTSLWLSFEGKGGKLYLLRRREKDFERWLQGTFMPAAIDGRLKEYLATDVLWENGEDRLPMAPDTFMTKLGPVLAKKLSVLRRDRAGYDIIPDDLNPYIYDRPAYKKYFDNCGSFLRMKYPAYTVLVSHYTAEGKLLYQEHFGFLRTAQGYRLVYVSMV